MMKGILAQKVGMTRVIDPETGKMVPVTLLYVPENTVLQVKTIAKDGYQSVVVGGFGRKKVAANSNRNYKWIKEVPCSEEVEVKKGDKIGLGIFKEVTGLKITGVSKGRGFAGVIKRHKFSRGPETHGSHHHREPGSVGMCAKPGRILKGKKMPGRHGGKTTTLSMSVVEVDLENNLLALKGAIPGANKGFVYCCES
jgi:large subunit ribosomal protein L3